MCISLSNSSDDPVESLAVNYLARKIGVYM
jgi:hypothetical protein